MNYFLQKGAKVAKVGFVLWRIGGNLAAGCGENEAVDSVNQSEFVEVDKQAEGYIHEFHIA